MQALLLGSSQLVRGENPHFLCLPDVRTCFVGVSPEGIIDQADDADDGRGVSGPTEEATFRLLY